MQQANSVVNGPEFENNHNLKENVDTPKVQQVINGASNPSSNPIINQNRAPPPLNRIDSRGSFPYRPAFPNQPGVPLRPQQLIRPPLPGQQQFINRQPVPGPNPRPPGQPFIPQQARGNFRPLSPFPRPPVPNQRPPGIFQQRSVPSFGLQRPPLLQEEQLQRSQTLDGSDILTNKTQGEEKHLSGSHEDRPALTAMKNRSYSLSDNAQRAEIPDNQSENRRQSVSSVENVEEVFKGVIPEEEQKADKKLEEVSSRPESRAASRMNRIVEDDDSHKSMSSKSPSSLTDVSQKSTDRNDSQNEIKSSSNSEELQQRKPAVQTKTEVQTRKLDLSNCAAKAKSPIKAEGDNDSGVDESTQGNDPSSNGDSRSPRKSSSKSRISSSTPTQARSLSRGSKSPSLKSPDSNATTPGSATEKKKLPMNKIQVGSAPSPNLKVVRSKIGSLENTSYKPGGGKVKIENKKIEFKNAASRIEAKNEKYVPKGGERKIQQQKLQWNAKSKIGSLENATYKPKGGEKKIESIKLDFKEKAKSKVGSKDNIKYVPGGGDIKTDDIADDKKDIENKKIELKVQSKIGSLDNMKHKPGGGDKKIFDDKDYLKQKSSVLSSENQSLSGSQNSLPSQPDVKDPLADENLNQKR